MKESKFQTSLIKELKNMFPDCIILKNDPGYIQGVPDLLILYKDTWAALECKKNLSEPFRPNQKYYLELFNNMSFSSSICPENREAVLYELQRSFASRRASRFSER